MNIYLSIADIDALSSASLSKASFWFSGIMVDVPNFPPFFFFFELYNLCIFCNWVLAAF